MQTKNAPAYVRFVTQLAAKYQELGIPVLPSSPEDKDGIRGPDGWANLEVDGSGDKVYLRRTRGGDPTMIETTVPFELIPPALIEKDMRDLNGKITARLKVDLAAIASGLLPVLKKRLEDGEKIRASKAPVRRASGKSWAQHESDELAKLRAEQAELKARLEQAEAERQAAVEASTLRA